MSFTHNPATPSPAATPPQLPHAPILWADPQREQAFNAWLQSVQAGFGLNPDSLRLASADASFRRYLRIDGSDGTRIIMDAPPALENCQPFVDIAALMAQAGLRVPQVLNWDKEHGFLLLTDLGEHTMMQTMDVARPQANHAQYLQAVDTLITWQLASRQGVLPAYDEPLLRRELSLFPDWYLARHRGIAVEGDVQKTLQGTFDQIIANNLAWPSVYVHRDFMPRNLMISPGNGGLGVLDFQDAVYGPITYDIASLMRDAFLSWEEDFVLDITIRYWQQARAAGLPVGDDFGEFYRGVEWMGLQRHLKVAGIFARLTLRDGKPKYLADTPRFMGYIGATASRYRELRPLLRLIEKVEGTASVSGYAYGRM